jgi:small subunit ribosomal protein S21
VSSIGGVHVQDGERLESALKRFKRKVMNEDIIKDIKKHGSRRRFPCGAL